MTTEGQAITCKAAVAWEKRKPLVIEDVKVAPPKSHEVRLKVIAASVCHMDSECLYQTRDGMKPRPFPMVLGHEAAGVVESVGPGVTKFRPESVVPGLGPLQVRDNTLDRHLSSVSVTKGKWLCTFWEAERAKFPDRENTQMGVLAEGTSRMSFKGQQIFQFLGVSAFSQYTVVPETSLTKLRGDAPLHKVFLLGCGVSTGYGAVINAATVDADSACAVFGLGAVGLAAVMGCKAAGARRIIAVDINPAKFEKARALGATDCVNPKDHQEPIQEVVAKMTGSGVDFAVECVGSPVVMASALESTRDAWGICIIAGWTEAEAMSVKVEKLLMGRTLQGTYFGGWKSVRDVPKLVDGYMDGSLKLDEFITHSLPLDQINQAFDTLRSGESVRTLIRMWPDDSESTNEFDS